MDLEDDREMVQSLQQKKRKPKDQDELRLNESREALGGLRAYGYLLYWECATSEPVVIRMALTGKGKTKGQVVYQAHFDGFEIPPKHYARDRVGILELGPKGERYDYIPFCDNDTHELPRDHLCFTVAELLKVYKYVHERFDYTMEYEAAQTLRAVEELGRRAQYLNEQRKNLRDQEHLFPTKIQLCLAKTISKSKGKSSKRAGAASTRSKPTKGATR